MKRQCNSGGAGVVRAKGALEIDKREISANLF